MYEVFINQHSLILSNYEARANYTQYNFDNTFLWSDLLKKTRTDKPLKLWVKSSDLELAWASFKSKYQLILAAGGLVHKDGKYLFIFRNGKWDLPKGKLESNEVIAECALREVEEECGIESLELESKLISTYHTYSMQGQMILKETHWYLMKTTHSAPFIPQKEEGIEKVEWKRKDEIPHLMENSFPNIQKVIDAVSS